LRGVACTGAIDPRSASHRWLPCSPPTELPCRDVTPESRPSESRFLSGSTGTASPIAMDSHRDRTDYALTPLSLSAGPVAHVHVISRYRATSRRLAGPGTAHRNAICGLTTGTAFTDGAVRSSTTRCAGRPNRRQSRFGPCRSAGGSGIPLREYMQAICPGPGYARALRRMIRAHPVFDRLFRGQKQKLGDRKKRASRPGSANYVAELEPGPCQAYRHSPGLH